jgi:hypothetical protein
VQPGTGWACVSPAQRRECQSNRHKGRPFETRRECWGAVNERNGFPNLLSDDGEACLGDGDRRILIEGHRGGDETNNHTMDYAPLDQREIAMAARRVTVNLIYNH